METSQIIELLENLPDNELVNLWNDYQGEISGESEVYDFDDEFLNEHFSEPAECARALFFGNVRSWGNKYIQFNGYGNLESSSYLDELISISDLANYIQDNQDNYFDLLERLTDEL